MIAESSSGRTPDFESGYDEPGAKFHTCDKPGMPVQFIKMLRRKDYPTNAVNLDTGEQYHVSDDEFVFPIDAGWVAELECYGFQISEELEAEGHRAIVAHVMNQTDARKANDHWREEITKYFPQLRYMSFAGASRTIRWLMEHVEIKKEFQETTANLLAIEASSISDEEKSEKRLQEVFPNLGKRIK